MSKTVLITGASRGLGWDLAHHFLAQGWNVLVNARTHAAVEELIQAGAIGVWGSVTTEFTRTELAAQVKTMGLDLLIHNAGTRPEQGFPELPAKDVSKTIITNLVAPMLLTSCLWPALKESQGQVVFINSLAGKQGGKDETAYSASKFGLRGFAQSLQYDGVRDGVRVLSVFPGAMKTQMAFARPDFEKLIDTEEMATTIYQLCNDQPSLRVTEVDLCRRRY